MNRFLSLGAVVLSAFALIAVLLTRSAPPVEADLSFGELDEVRELCTQQAYDMNDLEERTASLERAVSTLQLRVSAVERAGSAAPGAAPADAAGRELQALRSDVDALLAGDALNTEAGVERMKEVVRAVQGEEFADRARQRAVADERVRTERLGRFVQEAKLSSTQERDLKRLLDEEREKRTALSEQARQGQRDRREVFAETNQLRQQTDENVKRLLSGDQVGQYEAMRNQERRGGRRGPGGGGGTGGGRMGAGRGGAQQ